MKIVKTINDLKIQIDNACNKAVENACNRILGSLQQIIDEEFYEMFEPELFQNISILAFCHY